MCADRQESERTKSPLLALEFNFLARGSNPAAAPDYRDREGGSWSDRSKSPCVPRL